MPGTRMEIEEYPAEGKWEGMVEALDGSRNTRIIRVTAPTASEALERVKEAYYEIRPWERPDGGNGASGSAQTIQVDGGEVVDDSGKNSPVEAAQARRPGWYADPTPRSAMRERGRR